VERNPKGFFYARWLNRRIIDFMTDNFLPIKRLRIAIKLTHTSELEFLVMGETRTFHNGGHDYNDS